MSTGKFRLKAKIMRPIDTFATLTYQKGKYGRRYELLAQNGYIYRWAVPILKRYKAIDRPRKIRQAR